MSEDHSLCPAQALKVCLAKTGDKGKNKELLFISYNDGLKGDLHMNLFSGWVRKLIHHVYDTAQGEVLPPAYARTHLVCALVASLAFRGSVDMEDILSACFSIPVDLLRLLSLGLCHSDRRLPLPWTYFCCLTLLMLKRFSISWDLLVVLCPLPMPIVPVRPDLG